MIIYPVSTCSKSTVETPGKCGNSVQNNNKDTERRKMFVYADIILIKVSSAKAKMKRTICPK